LCGYTWPVLLGSVKVVTGNDHTQPFTGSGITIISQINIIDTFVSNAYITTYFTL